MVDPRSGALVPVASTDEVETFLSMIVPALPRWLARSETDRRDTMRAVSAGLRACEDELIDVLRFEFEIDEERAAAQVRRSWQRILDISDETDVRHDRIAPGVCAFVLSRHRAGKVLTASIARVLLNESIVVIKPSLATPLSTHLLTEIICRSAPPGTVNLIHGDEETVDALVSSPLLGSVFVDGSPEAEAHVSRLGDLFRKPVIPYAEDDRFARSGHVNRTSK